MLDVGALRPGVGWPMQLRASDVLLLVIGPTSWERPSRRHSPRGLPVVPLLVSGATMPASEQLPPPLAKLAGIQAVVLEEAAWREGVQRLVRSLRVRRRPRDATTPLRPGGRVCRPRCWPLPRFVDRERHGSRPGDRRRTCPGVLGSQPINPPPSSSPSSPRSVVSQVASQSSRQRWCGCGGGPA
jgi:hypothetical protein